MRQIKFRIWNKLMDKMCYPTEYIKFNYYSDGVGVEVEYGEPEYPKNYAIRSNDIKLMQFTGLHDKNGVEIYEGDIVQFKRIQAKIVFDMGSFCFEWIDGRTDEIRGEKVEVMFANTSLIFEVIGNIYENPELVKP